MYMYYVLLVDCYVVNILYIFDVLVYICFHLITGEDIYRRSLLSNPFGLKLIKYLKLKLNLSMIYLLDVWTSFIVLYMFFILSKWYQVIRIIINKIISSDNEVCIEKLAWWKTYSIELHVLYVSRVLVGVWDIWRAWNKLFWNRFRIQKSVL